MSKSYKPEKIIGYLKQGKRTVNDVADKFELTRDSARRAILEVGAPEVGTRPGEGRGRPAILYSLR